MPRLSLTSSWRPRLGPVLLVAVAACCPPALVLPALVPPARAEAQAQAAGTADLSFAGDTPTAVAGPHRDDTPNAGPVGCTSCTGTPRLVPVCRRVPVTRKKPHVEYDIRCEMICVPGCGCLGRGGLSSCTDCDSGACDDVRIRQKKLLLKTITQKEFDTYEYQVEWVCADCAAGRDCRGPRPLAGMARLWHGLCPWWW